MLREYEILRILIFVTIFKRKVTGEEKKKTSIF